VLYREVCVCVFDAWGMVRLDQLLRTSLVLRIKI
jgi:hypothetical protein